MSRPGVFNVAALQRIHALFSLGTLEVNSDVYETSELRSFTAAADACDVRLASLRCSQDRVGCGDHASKQGLVPGLEVPLALGLVSSQLCLATGRFRRYPAWPQREGAPAPAGPQGRAQRAAEMGMGVLVSHNRHSHSSLLWFRFDLKLG